MLSHVLLALALVPFATLQSPSASATDIAIVSVAATDQMTDISGRIWTPSTPDFRAVVIRTRLTRGVGYEVKDFSLSYGPASKTLTAICAGHTARIPSGWVINEKDGASWSFFPGGTGTLEGLGVLFVIPKDVTLATLHYKGKPVGTAFEIR